MAQRLVRRLCPQCKALHPVPLEGSADTPHYRPVGCAVCGHSGYKGRYGVYELLLVDDALQRLIHDRASEQKMRDHAARHGMRSLRDDGLRWVKAGETSLEEIMRVTRN